MPVAEYCDRRWGHLCEPVARAIYEACPEIVAGEPVPWRALRPARREQLLARARAALAPEKDEGRRLKAEGKAEGRGLRAEGGLPEATP